MALAGGYYTIEQKVQKLRLVMLNTNLCSDIVDNEEDPAGQWAWLDDTLEKSQRNRETVNILYFSILLHSFNTEYLFFCPSMKHIHFLFSINHRHVNNKQHGGGKDNTIIE
jgi:hypothetical protein